MIPNNCIANKVIIIKLDDQEKLLTINNLALKVLKKEGYFTFIHRDSNSVGTSKFKYEAYRKLIRSTKFKDWYNLQIAQVLGYDHLTKDRWQKLSKKIIFQVMKNNKWIEINEDFFILDYKDLNII